jgi:hypothetical protein
MWDDLTACPSPEVCCLRPNFARVAANHPTKKNNGVTDNNPGVKVQKQK